MPLSDERRAKLLYALQQVGCKFTITLLDGAELDLSKLSNDFLLDLLITLDDNGVTIVE